MAYDKRNAPVRNVIIGRVVASPQDTKTTVGYAIISFNDFSSNYLVTTLPTRTVYNKILKGEIENATVVQGVEVITLQGVTEKDLPITLANQTDIPVSDKVFILDRVIKKVDGVDRSIGFRVFTYTGIVIIPVDKLIAAHKSKQIVSINAKVVNRDGKDIISSKKGNFGVILAYSEGDKKGQAEFKESISTPTTERVDVDEHKKHNKVKYRKKALEYFLHEFATRGRISKINTRERAKKAKVVLNEFFVKKYPVLKELKDFDNNLIIEAGVVLHLSASKQAFSSILNQHTSHRATVGHLVADLDYTSANEVYNFLSDERFNVVPVILDFLKLRNDVLQRVKGLTITAETHLLIEDLIESLKSFTFREETKEEKESGVNVFSTAFFFVTKGYYYSLNSIRAKSLKKLKVYDKKVINTIPFTEPSGFNYMGYALIGDSKVGTVEKTIYGERKLRSMFNLGVPNLKIAVPSGVQKGILSNVRTFGDAEIVRSLLLLKFALNNNISYSEYVSIDKWDIKNWGTDEYKKFSDSDYIRHEMNIRLAVLAQYNYHLAKVMNDYLDEVATFSLRDAEAYIVGDGKIEEAEVFYQSGMKFNNPYGIVGDNKSWGYTDSRPALNTIPKFTFGMLKSVGLLDKETDYINARYHKLMDRLKNYCRE